MEKRGRIWQFGKSVLGHCGWEGLGRDGTEKWDVKKNGIIRGIGSYDRYTTDGTDETDERDGTGERMERKEQM